MLKEEGGEKDESNDLGVSQLQRCIRTGRKAL
jgi:hypothetical protein